MQTSSESAILAIKIKILLPIILKAEVQLFPATLALLTNKVVTSDLHSKDDLVETGTTIIENLLVLQWNPKYEAQVQTLMKGLWSVSRWENYRHICGPARLHPRGDLALHLRK